MNSFIFSQCTPIEVSTYISEKDGWMFPYSTFYWGMSDGVLEISNTNQECYQLLENNEECINDCIYLEQEEVDEYLGRIGCIYYNCPDGDSLIQNYDEYSQRPFHLYGQYYCSDDTVWDEEYDVCISSVCNGDLNGDDIKNVTDIVQMVNEILSNENECE
tara:strand:+ start:756 stop:1235 length:480 start_codon:yes stop_codon:yes gene_type:complete